MYKFLRFKKIQDARKEYNLENNTDVSLEEFFYILNYTKEDLDAFLNAKHSKPKKSGESKRVNKLPYISKEVGDKENPEYEKYYNIVLEFREYMCNRDIRPEGDEKKTMRTFMKYKYELEGDAALIEMRKIENIVYKNKKSHKEKRNKRREQREIYFNNLLNL